MQEDVSNNGTVVKLEQLLNIYEMSVHDDVLNNGTVVKLEQLLNIADILTQEDVSNNGTVVKLQPSNMLFMLVTPVVFNIPART